LTINNTTSYLVLVLVAIVLVLGLAVVAWVWRGPELVVAAGWLTTLVVLGLFGLKATWSLNHAHGGDPRELMILTATAQDVRTLVTELEAVSLAQAGDAHTIEITVDTTTGPIVAWYLRNFEGQIATEGISSLPATLAVITPGTQDPPIGETFRGQSFPLQASWLPWGLRGQDLVRWLLFGVPSGRPPTVDQEVVLWVSNEP
jgi:hypothetical protein